MLDSKFHFQKLIWGAEISNILFPQYGTNSVKRDISLSIM